MKLNDTVYNYLKWFIAIFLPAFGAAYFSLSDIWGLPNTLQVVGTVTVIETFLGVIFGLSTKAYNDDLAKYHDANAGWIMSNGVDQDTGMPNLQVVFNDRLPVEILEKESIELKVHSEKPTRGEI